MTHYKYLTSRWSSLHTAAFGIAKTIAELCLLKSQEVSVIVFGHRLNRVLIRNLADIDIAVLKGTQLPADTKKTGLKIEPKEAVTGPAAANAAQKPAGILKSQKENMPRCDNTSKWDAKFSVSLIVVSI